MLNTAIDRDVLYAILEKGTLASSGDNMQPWKFRLAEGAVYLSVVPNPAGHFFETGHRTLYLSAGAVIENMRVAATKYGYGLDISYFPEPSSSTCVAKVVFCKQPGLETHPHESILKDRCTNRKLYDPEKIVPEAVYEKISESIRARLPQELLWIKKTDERYGRLSKVMAEGDELRFKNKRIHLEFMECLRYNKKEIESTKDGLDINSLETGPGAGLIFKMLSSWKTLSFLNRLGFCRQFYQYTLKQMGSSQAAGLVVAPTHSPEDYVKGGETMQAAWNEIAFQGLSMQPMEGVPVFLINLALEGDHAFSAEQKTQVAKMREEFLSLFNISDQRGLILLFRVGYGDGPSARSLRRPVETFIET